MGKKEPRVNGDMLQQGGALARQLNHYKSHWINPVTGSVLACQLCRWDSGENIIVQVKFCILCNVNLCVKHFAVFHMSQTIVEDREI